MRCKVWPPLCNARDPQSPFPTTPSLIRLNCRVRFFCAHDSTRGAEREKKMSCFFQGKLCAANGLLFFYLVAHTIVCCQVEKTEGKKTTFFFFLVRFAGKGFPNDLSKQSAWKSNFSRWPLDFQLLCNFPSLFGFWKKIVSMFRVFSRWLLCV